MTTTTIALATAAALLVALVAMIGRREFRAYKTRKLIRKTFIRDASGKIFAKDPKTGQLRDVAEVLAARLAPAPDRTSRQAKRGRKTARRLVKTAGVK